MLDYLAHQRPDTCCTSTWRQSEMNDILERAPELASPIEDLSLPERYRDEIATLINLVFPPAFFENELIGAAAPFSIDIFYSSLSFKQLFVDENGMLAGRLNMDDEQFLRGRIIMAYLLILEKFYGIRQTFSYPIIRIVPDPDTGLERYFKMNLDFRFFDIQAVNTPPELTDAERDLVLDQLTDPEILMAKLPPENFELHGFTIIKAVDVTEAEVIAALSRDLIDQETIVSIPGFQQLQTRLRILFRRADLILGLAAIKDDHVLLLTPESKLDHHCIFADSRHIPITEFQGGMFARAACDGKIVRIADLRESARDEHAAQMYLKNGFRSILIAPLLYKGECIGTLDIASPRPNDFEPMDAMLVSQIQPLFAIALNKALNDLENNIQKLIKEKCTAIHPSVEWRFRQAALRHFEELHQGRDTEMESIVFKKVYPFYSVSDIRGSTDIRNMAIRKDLAEHLMLAMKVVNRAKESNHILILQELASRIVNMQERIEAGITTDSELSVMYFLSKEVEPVFDFLQNLNENGKVEKAIADYHAAVDPALGTVYQRRKAFEDSTSMLNERLAAYLEQAESEVQAIFPHYFEMHRTDGVDYLIYMGASLTERDDFNRLYLDNLHLWQLKVACGMVWHTEQLKSDMPIPLDTAHLILIQNTPLSIRFRIDEKRFDVDGAYDIRHEIIKSRIDKAVVKKSRERLTQPGKIAVVYGHPAEAREMRRHLDFLRSENFLTDEQENLELEDMPGVQGLRALRVNVNPEAQL
ncbi:GAF domain-containing protein [Desulfococcaceae bacterium HSG9]|nr:GAF domain-containing protein [Desulfococcaceae bacterium HSG9]